MIDLMKNKLAEVCNNGSFHQLRQLSLTATYGSAVKRQDLLLHIIQNINTLTLIGLVLLVKP